MLHRVDLVGTDVSEERIAFVMSVALKQVNEDSPPVHMPLECSNEYTVKMFGCHINHV
jgi:hypothetical protein